jgi:hypothetical protein
VGSLQPAASFDAVLLAGHALCRLDALHKGGAAALALGLALLASAIGLDLGRPMPLLQGRKLPVAGLDDLLTDRRVAAIDGLQVRFPVLAVGCRRLRAFALLGAL